MLQNIQKKPIIMKIVHTTQDRIIANILKAELENNNIEAVIMDKRDSAISSFGHLEIYVPEPNFQHAQKIIRESLKKEEEE